MDKIVLKVPRISAPDDRQYDFVNRLRKEFNGGQQIVVDFDNVPGVSSMAIGIIFFVLKKNPKRIEFLNISRSLHESLQVVVGEFAGKLTEGFQTPPGSNAGAGAPPKPA